MFSPSLGLTVVSKGSSVTQRAFWVYGLLFSGVQPEQGIRMWQRRAAPVRGKHTMEGCLACCVQVCLMCSLFLRTMLHISLL